MKPTAPRTNPDRFLNILFLLSLFLFIVIAALVHFYPVNSFDSFIQKQGRPIPTQTQLLFWTGISFFGSFEFLFPAWIVFIGIKLWQRRSRFGISAAGLAAGGFLSVQVLKQIFQRHRPPTPFVPNFTDYSFPSGHSTSSFIFFAILSYSLWHSKLPRSLRIAGMAPMIILPFLVGLSRVILNVHYPTDVAAGFCFGILWVITWDRLKHSNKRD